MKEKFKETLIRYPRFTELHNTIQRCQQLSKITNEPQCLSLEGRPGAGKSTLITTYAATFPSKATQDGTIIPVFYTETPSPVTVKGMAQTILDRLGDPAAYIGSQPSLNSRLVKLIKACGVELVILDDFHHLIDTETNKILLKVSDWLKVLIKETGVPFLVVGVEGKVQQILKSNEQLSRLFAEREILLPFTWDVENPSTIKEFNNFIQYVEKIIGSSLPQQLPRTELLFRMHYATEGVVANIMNLMRYAQRLVIEQKSNDLQLQHLSTAFEKRLSRHLVKKVNPFTQEEGRFVPPPEDRKY